MAHERGSSRSLEPTPSINSPNCFTFTYIKTKKKPSQLTHDYVNTSLHRHEPPLGRYEATTAQKSKLKKFTGNQLTVKIKRWEYYLTEFTIKF